MVRFLTWKNSAVLLIFLALGGIVFVFSAQPSHDRQWELGQEKLPAFHVYGDVLKVENYRDFVWTGELTAEPEYETRQFNLAKLTDLDVFISHFNSFEGLAHIFLSFGFSGGERLVVSLESRREVGETFSPLLGMLRQYEIIYVVGSEEDIVGARTSFRNERVYRYPTVATVDQARALLLGLGEDINSVATQPKFYNTLTHNCTNEITRRVETMSDAQFPLTWKTLLPGYFDEVLYDMNLIQKSGSFAETKAARLINNAVVNPRGGRFIQELRGAIPPRDVVTPVTPSVPDTPANWKAYTNETLGISLLYDPTFTLSEDAPEQVRFYKWGPTQRGQTEMYDGVLVDFRRVTLEESFEAYLDRKVKEFQEVGTITRPLSDYDVNGRAAKVLSVSVLGDFTLIFLPLSDDSMLEISTLAPDPTGAGFQNIVDQILATVRVAL